MKKKLGKKFGIKSLVDDQPESADEMVNKYGTYNIQPTTDTENLFPLIGPEMPERWRHMSLGKDDLEHLG